jgi:hypothetical protein
MQETMDAFPYAFKALLKHGDKFTWLDFITLKNNFI